MLDHWFVEEGVELDALVLLVNFLQHSRDPCLGDAFVENLAGANESDGSRGVIHLSILVFGGGAGWVLLDEEHRLGRSEWRRPLGPRLDCLL